MRKLAQIKTIDKIRPIEGADKIEVLSIGGWDVVSKKGEHQVNDKVVYFEVDSWIPVELAPFLQKDKKRFFNGVEGERLRTIRLRGQLSQGLVLPLSILDSYSIPKLEGMDLTEILNIQKYEPPVPATLSGEVKGNFPIFIPKTDEERCQNLTKEIKEYLDSGTEFEVSVKLDGSSMTVYYNLEENQSGVCSRNLELKLNEANQDNSFVKTAQENNILEALERYCTQNSKSLALQGELMGPGIQKNPEKLQKLKYFVYNIYDIQNRVYLSTEERLSVLEHLKEHCTINHVPVLHESITLKDFGVSEENPIKSLLELAEGKSINSEIREGLVFKNYSTKNPQGSNIRNGITSFKAISNKFLLKNE